MTTLVRQTWIDNGAVRIAIGKSPNGGTVDAIGADPTQPDAGGEIGRRHGLGTELQFTVEPSVRDDAEMDGEIEAVPLSDWDIVDAASLDSFPASDPPSWWAGGSGNRST